ncbi:MAG: Autoinducer 2 import system permease protein LsrD [Fimbriimonadaceae bacterium]|nr:Autoinducer 2 import system permease protein LsrD [Fimbriimonadaceae bacterium]
MSKGWTHRDTGLAILLVGLLLYARSVEPNFVTLRTQTLLAGHIWELALICLPMLLIIVTGGIDLSVGAMVALAAVTLGLLHERGLPVAVACAAAVVAGGLMGWINGRLIGGLRVHPLIVTLATMAAFRGVAEGLSRARAISGYPDGFLRMSTKTFLGLTGPGWLFVAILILAGYVLTRSVMGRWLIALGTEERATRFSGIPVDRLKTWLYTACGAVCGLAAIILVSRNNTAKADLAVGMELEAITVVVLGGANINGGSGSIAGTVLALFLVHLTREFVSWHWKQSEIILIVMGALLLGSVAFQRLIESRNRVASAKAGGTTHA